MRTSPRGSSSCSVLLACLTMAAGAPSRAAQPTSSEARSTATALFDEARRLMAAGRMSEACPKLEESQRLSPGIGTLYNLANCYEKLGRTATAWRIFREVVSQSSLSGQSKRADAASARVRALEPRLSRMAIVVPAPVPGIRVARDGVDSAPPAWGVEVPVDPGEHVVAATAPKYVTWEKRVTVEGGNALVKVEVPPLQPEQAIEPVATKSEESNLVLPPPIEPNARLVPLPSRGGTKAGIAGVAVGALGVGAGIALGLWAKSKADGAACDAQNFCTPEGLSRRSDAHALGNVGTGVFIGGAVIAAAGAAVWIATSYSMKSGPVTIGVGATGVVAQGSF